MNEERKGILRKLFANLFHLHAFFLNKYKKIKSPRNVNLFRNKITSKKKEIISLFRINKAH